MIKVSLLLIALLSLTACKLDINGDLKGGHSSTNAGAGGGGAGAFSGTYSIDFGGTYLGFVLNSDGTYILKQYTPSSWMDIGGTYTKNGLEITLNSFTYFAVSDAGTVPVCGTSDPSPDFALELSSDLESADLYYLGSPMAVLAEESFSGISAPDVSAMPDLCP